MGMFGFNRARKQQAAKAEAARIAAENELASQSQSPDGGLLKGENGENNQVNLVPEPPSETGGAAAVDATEQKAEQEVVEAAPEVKAEEPVEAAKAEAAESVMAGPADEAKPVEEKKKQSKNSNKRGK